MNKLTYIDPLTGRHRIKRRYLYAIWAFAAGALVGAIIVVVL